MPRPKSKNKAMLAPLQKLSLREQAASVIRRHIISMKLQPGQGLPTERALSESLAVSRTVVREALVMLEAEGLLECRPSVGYFVKQAPESGSEGEGALAAESHLLLEQSFETRVSLELGALHVILPRVTDTQLDQLEQMALEIDQAMEQQKATATVELDFHMALLELSNNAMLVALGRQVIGDYFRMLALYRPSGLINPPDLTANRHLPLVQALRTRDLKTATDALWQHCQPPKAADLGFKQEMSPFCP
jgi:GntR family transcriptional repressor for pyruvate dehydrogenase complex